MTAEEWIVHRRSFQRAHGTARVPTRLAILRGGPLSGIRVLPDADIALLGLAGHGAPSTQAGAVRRLALLAACCIVGGILVGLAETLAGDIDMRQAR